MKENKKKKEKKKRKKNRKKKNKSNFDKYLISLRVRGPV